MRDRALERLRGAGLSVRSLQGRDAAEALDLARQCVAEGVDALVVCGGDGMVHLAVQALAGTGTPLGIIPAGTGNDVARYFDLPRKDPEAAASRIVAGQHQDDRPGAQRLAVLRDRARGGLRRRRERARQPDDLAEGPDALQHRDAGRAAGLQAPALHPAARRPRRCSWRRCWSRSATAPSFGGGLRITEGAVLDDGYLDVVIIKPITKPDLVRTYPKLFKGTHIHHPQYEHHLVRSVTVAAPGIVSYADGERFGPLPLTVECAPGALTVLV